MDVLKASFLGLGFAVVTTAMVLFPVNEQLRWTQWLRSTWMRRPGGFHTLLSGSLLLNPPLPFFLLCRHSSILQTARPGPTK